jgi:CRISPR type I-E-associated protein CasB/Cse2
MKFNIARLSKLDRGERSHLRQILQHSLDSPPLAAMRHIEGELNSEGESPNSTELRMQYLIAGLYALRHPDPYDSPVNGVSFAVAAAQLTAAKSEFDQNKQSPLERRFLSLLDSSRDELTFPLRQWITLFKQAGAEIDWVRLLRELTRWGDGIKDAWGRDYYRTLKHAAFETDDSDMPQEA